MKEAKRLGCLYIPDFRIQVHRRDEALDPVRPLVLLSRGARRQTVVAVSPEAARDGVRVGMSLAQAEVASPHTLLREEDPGCYAAVGQTLLAQLHAVSPVVEAVRLGLYYVGMKGMRWLYEDEKALLRTILDTLHLSGFIASAGAASTRFTALAAAQQAYAVYLADVAGQPQATRAHAGP